MQISNKITLKVANQIPKQCARWLRQGLGWVRRRRCQGSLGPGGSSWWGLTRLRIQQINKQFLFCSFMIFWDQNPKIKENQGWPGHCNQVIRLCAKARSRKPPNHMARHHGALTRHHAHSTKSLEWPLQATPTDRLVHLRDVTWLWAAHLICW